MDVWGKLWSCVGGWEELKRRQRTRVAEKLRMQRTIGVRTQGPES